MTLDKVKVNEKCIVKKIFDSSKIKRRLLDIGLIPNTLIECVLESPNKDICAYLIRNSVIAIRKCDAKEIEVCYDK